MSVVLDTTTVFESHSVHKMNKQNLFKYTEQGGLGCFDSSPQPTPTFYTLHSIPSFTARKLKPRWPLTAAISCGEGKNTQKGTIVGP